MSKKKQHLHALYFDGTTYFVEQNGIDYDKVEWELLETSDDMEYLFDKAVNFNATHNDGICFDNELYFAIQ